MRKFIILLIASASLAPLHAQTFTATAPARHEIKTTPQEVTIGNSNVAIDGIVKEIFVTKKPWQLVNPAAPASYGSGEKVVSKDSGPGTPYHSTGVVVAGVAW